MMERNYILMILSSGGQEIGGGKHRKGRYGDEPMLSKVGPGRKQT